MHNMLLKKPKLLKQFPETSSDAIVLFTGSVLSPVTSQKNNITCPTKFIKMSKDQRRKNKEMKRDHLKRRLESQRFESNGNLVVEQYAQHVAKKPKLLKQFPETSSDAIVPFTGSVLSPVTSQKNNISGPTKFIKMSKDQGRKNKEMKHVFQSPSECEERHKILMESNVDAADSAEDSGSSEQYKSTLPGIPKGCARQLFQNLEAPVGEYILDDTLIARFEKIISIGQKPHSFWTLNDTQAPEE